MVRGATNVAGLWVELASTWKGIVVASLAHNSRGQARLRLAMLLLLLLKCGKLQSCAGLPHAHACSHVCGPRSVEVPREGRERAQGFLGLQAESGPGSSADPLDHVFIVFNTRSYASSSCF